MLRKLALLGIAAFVGREVLKSRQIGGQTTAPGQTGPAARLTQAATDPGHVTRDLDGDTHPDGSIRAEDHFRPDPHASIPPEDREGLRPATTPISGTPASYLN